MAEELTMIKENVVTFARTKVMVSILCMRITNVMQERKTVPMVRSMVSTPKTPKTSFGTCGNYALAFINIKLSEGIY